MRKRLQINVAEAIEQAESRGCAAPRRPFDHVYAGVRALPDFGRLVVDKITRTVMTWRIGQPGIVRRNAADPPGTVMCRRKTSVCTGVFFAPGRLQKRFGGHFGSSGHADGRNSARRAVGWMAPR